MGIKKSYGGFVSILVKKYSVNDTTIINNLLRQPSSPLSFMPVAVIFYDFLIGIK